MTHNAADFPVCETEEGPSLLLWVLYWLAVATGVAVIWLGIGSVSRERRKRGHTLQLTAALFLLGCSGSALSAGRHALGHAPLAIVFWSLPPLLYMIYFYLYSNVRYTARSTRWLAVLFALSLIGTLSNAPSTSKGPNSPYVAHLPHVVLASILLIADALAVAVVVVGVVPQVYGRRRALAESASSAATDWRALGAALAGGIALLAVAALSYTQPFGPSGPSLFAQTAIYFMTVLLPVPIAFAVLSVRPLDRQAITLRVAVYGTLTLCLTIAYAATCLAASIVVPLAAPGGLQIAVIAGALVMVGLFRPLSRWLHTSVEGLLFPTLDQTRRTLALASGEVAAEIQLDSLCERLASAVQAGLHPTATVLWVRTTPSFTAQAVERLLPGKAASAAAGADKAPTIAMQPKCRAGEGDSPQASQVVLTSDDPARAMLPVRQGALPAAHLPVESRAAYALKAAGMALILPLVAEGELVGLLGLGPKCDTHPYSYDECELIDQLGTAAAPGLRVALVVHEQDTETRTRERSEQELRTARRIQQTLLPKEVPQLDGWRMDVYYEPAREVGGDFYDFLRFADGRLGIVLGDVTDKGVPAALVMATTRSMLRAAAQASTPPGAVLARVNDLLYDDTPASMFVTCFYGILDPASGTLCFANAGQDLPFRRGADAHVSEVRATGMPLGLMPGMTYEEQEVTLAAGDLVLFYSDGLVEAHDPRRGMFGFPRLATLLGGEMPADGPIPGLLAELAHFTGPEWEQEDDITLVALRRTSEKGS